jgi:chemotaxis protein methyltransferase CheR
VSEEFPGDEAALHTVLRRAGIEYNHYKLKCIQRRLAMRMRARGVVTYDDYARLLDLDGSEARLLEKALTINVSRFFRNRHTFETIAELVIPELWERQQSAPIQVWSAGCAGGEEAYSLAALFHRHAAMRGEPWLERVRITGTDVDEASLRAAERAVYQEAALAEAPPELRERYFERRGPEVVVAPELRPLVRFEQRDLILDPDPPERFDLILCRNVIIYFEQQAQHALLQRFHRCSRPNAFLVLGRVEAILGPSRRWFQPAVIRSRIYRRLPP